MRGHNRTWNGALSTKNLGVLTRACVTVALLYPVAWLSAPLQAQGVTIPNFWDPRARIERPDLSGVRSVRFMTDDEFPPLHFAGPDGTPTGFAVELARAACERLSLACTIQTRRFDTLLPALEEKAGDVVVAGIPLTPELQQRFGATAPYFKTPARFVARKDRAMPDPVGAAVRGRSIGVIGGTAHEVFAKTFLPGANVRDFPDAPAALRALRAGEIEYAFGDGLGLALWIGGTEAANCCGFVGGPYLHPRFFGDGVSFILRKEDETLRRAFDHALQRLWEDGKYAELYLRFFPVSPF
jgi:polar amino acid transport system substrate-binding protein